MSEFKGTKGNTKVFNECFKNEYDFYVQPISISSRDNLLFANAYGTTKKECIANAKLIACAPEMLEIIKKLLIEFEYEDATESEYILYNEAKQLIKKATEL